jgi:hypothetical protein
MALPNIFDTKVSESIINRINQLTHETQPKWGKMSVSQMLAHCCVTYEYVYEPNKYPAPGFMFKIILKAIVKKSVTNEIPYKHNLRTGPDFLISDKKDFDFEKNRLIEFIKRVQKEGENSFDGRVSHSFGKLNKTQWNNMFYKHLDHHLSQFGV